MFEKERSWRRPSGRRFTRRAVLLRGAVALGSVAGLGAAACAARKPVTGSLSGTGRSNQTPQPGGTLSTFISGNIGLLDPLAGAPALSQSIVTNGEAYSHLFQYQAGVDPATYLNYNVEPDLGLSGESPDGLTWTIKLRSGATFFNLPPVSGHAVEAEDVKASFVRAFSTPYNPLKVFIGMIDPAQITMPDKQTVVFKLQYQYGPFKEPLTGLGTEIEPREALAGRYDPAKLVIGSGPFLLDSNTSDVAVMLKKNAAWFRPGLPYIDGVRAAIVEDPATQRAQFTAGNLDVSHPQSNDLATFQQSNPKASVTATSTGIATSIFGHMNLPSSPWRDVRVRQAVSMAIDRAGLKKAVLNNRAADNAFLPATAGKWMLPVDKFGDAAQYYQYNPAEVKKLLQATAGGPQLTRLLYPTQAYGPAFDAASTTVASMLNSAGFKIQPVPLDYNKDFIGGGNGALSGNYPADALLMAGNTFFSSAEETLYGQFQSSSTKNKSQVTDATVDQMLNKMRATPDDAARLQLCYAIQKYLAPLVYFVPLPSEEVYTALQPWVHNWYAGGGDGRAFNELWIKH